MRVIASSIRKGNIIEREDGQLCVVLSAESFHPGKGTQCAREVIRKHVEHLHVDRPLYNDHNKMKELVKSGEILEEVEKAVGELN